MSDVVYQYRSLDGALRYEVVRRVGADGKKTFLQRHPDGNGGWIYNLNGVKPLLYRLPELLPHETIFVVEGEKDADNLWDIGLPATTCSGGANEGRWPQSHSVTLRSIGVKAAAILHDNDPPGELHARRVAASLMAAGVKAKIVDLPGLPPKGDVSDWLEAGGDRAALAAIVRTTPLLASPPTVEAPERRARGQKRSTPEARAVRDLLGLPPSPRRVLVRCPFHQDDTPSFSVDLLTGQFYCHGGCWEPKGGGPRGFVRKWWKAKHGREIRGDEVTHEIAVLLHPTAAKIRDGQCQSPTSSDSTGNRAQKSPAALVKTPAL